MKPTPWPASLTKTDREMFTRLKIQAELVKAAHVERVKDRQGWNKWRLPKPRNGSFAGVVFPYTDRAEAEIVSCRVRRDNPEIKKNGKPDGKYLSPEGTQYLYYPPGAAEKLRNPDTIIVLVEAEKSSLAITAWAEKGDRSILALATHGCWGWSEEKEPLPDLVEVCRGRTVTVMMDANAATNPQVQGARAALVAALYKMGCTVLIADTPQMEGVNGPDDVLALKAGDDLFEAALSSARPAVVAPYSDDALAAKFSEQYKADVRYVQAWDSWFVWDGQRWKQDDTQRVARLVQEMCELAARECARPAEANRVRSVRTRTAVQGEAGVHGRLGATVEQWDTNLWLLNTPGGTVDLRTGKLRPAAREDYCTKMTAVAPGGDCPQWRAFLIRVTNKDTALQAYLKRACGYMLTGTTTEQVMFFLYGTGANGKSVFINALNGVLGDYAQVSAIEAFTASHNEPHPTGIAAMQGARLVTATETEQGRRWAETKLKSITGGEPIAARYMRQDFFTFRPQFKLVVSGNHRPGLRTVDEAMKRRMNLVPFSVTIPTDERDPRLAEKLRAEWPGILQWMVTGCLAWQRAGLRAPKVVNEATNSYMEGEDTLGNWLKEKTEQNKNSRTQPSELYRAYKGWTEANNEYVLSQKQFSQQLADRSFPSKKMNGIRYIVGLRLLKGRVGAEPPNPPIGKNKKIKNSKGGLGRNDPPRPSLRHNGAVGRSRKFAGGKPWVN